MCFLTIILTRASSRQLATWTSLVNLYLSLKALYPHLNYHLNHHHFTGKWEQGFRPFFWVLNCLNSLKNFHFPKNYLGVCLGLIHQIIAQKNLHDYSSFEWRNLEYNNVSSANLLVTRDLSAYFSLFSHVNITTLIECS